VCEEGKGEKEADVRRQCTLYSCDHIILDRTRFGSMVTDDYYTNKNNTVGLRPARMTDRGHTPLVLNLYRSTP